MRTIEISGKIFVALAMIVFGLQHFYYSGFVTRAFPPIPVEMTVQPALAYIFGLCLCSTGIAIIMNRRVYEFSLLLGSLILITFIFFLLPKLLLNLDNGIIWTNSGKALVLAGTNFIVATNCNNNNDKNTSMRLLNHLTPLGKFFLAGFFILAAILHFIYSPFVANLIPGWIPWHLFWTYFAAVALIAGAIGMFVPNTVQLAASMSGLMIFLWIVLLHIPRAVANIHDSNETTALFEALAMCGGALLVAANAARLKQR